MENYQSILKEIDSISKELEVSISAEIKEYIAKEVGIFCMDVLDKAERICLEKNRKIISYQDIKQELDTRNHPFDGFFDE